IQAEGPISVEAFMEACNAYYYATRDPFGADGDFTTAPEVSQMFGEMIGAALADAWKRAGAPSDAIYAELGPGRGTLAADALRVLRSAGFAGDVHFVETSPVLRQAQGNSVPGARWHDTVDALPVRQIVAGIERRVMVAAGGFAFDRDGEIVENSPARDQAISAIATCLAHAGGMALIIDYGHERTAPGETLQAVRGHRFASVLEQAGEQDLTAHVDFEAVARAAREAGAAVTPVFAQGEWLIRLGIEARAQALSRANPERVQEVGSALKRLTSADGMGALFKVVALHSREWPAPAGFA